MVRDAPDTLTGAERLTFKIGELPIFWLHSHTNFEGEGEI
jgi:hypothetical protein